MSTVARAFRRAKVDAKTSQTRTPSGLCNRSFRSLAPISLPSQDLRLIPPGRPLAQYETMRQRFVYVLTNADNPPRYYTGLTSDVARRLRKKTPARRGVTPRRSERW